MTLQNLNILHIDDDEIIRRQVKQALQLWKSENINITVTSFSNFDEGLKTISSETNFDLVILDLLEGDTEEKGKQIYNSIKDVQFIPIVFYTALPNSVESMPLVKVVGKGSRGIEELRNAILEQIETGFITFDKALSKHLQEIKRAYMWEFINKHGTDFLKKDEGLLGRLLLRRIASALQDSTIETSLNALGANLPKRQESCDSNEVPVHPVEFYIVPPVKKHFSAGDFFTEKVNNNDIYWVLIHPTCDMVPKIKNQVPFYKAERVLLCKAMLLSEQPEYLHWKSNTSNTKKLRTVIGNNRETQPDRFWFLPGVLDVPNMVLDFQEVQTVDFSSLNTLTWVASLDSPFAENLIISYSRYKGRIGIPVVNCDYLISKIESNQALVQVAATLPPISDALNNNS